MISGKVVAKSSLVGMVSQGSTLSGKVSKYQGSTETYEALRNKPKLNGIELSGDKTGSEYGLLDDINELSNQDILQIFNNVIGDE